MRVLILTIEEEPPGLYSYADDKEITGAPFSKHYEDFFKKCLQKNPKSRPTADELLRHKFLKSRTKEALVDELLTRIPTVASAYPANSGSACTAALNDCAGDRSRLPGESRIQLDLERGEQAGSGGYAGGGSDEGSFASGTSWVFDLDEPSFESQSRVFRRTSGGQGGSSSSLRVTLRASGSGAALGSIGDSAGALAGEAPSSSKRNHVASENVDMQDFLRDFENEISVGEAVERPADVPTATRGDVKESNTSNTPGASASASASPPARAARAARASSDSETAIFMDELEGIVDGNG
jgi:serine/threonine protein kinase